MQKLEKGSYTAHWGAYILQVRGDADTWSWRAWVQPEGQARRLIRDWTASSSRGACGAIREAAQFLESSGGSSVFVDGRQRPLEDFLYFSPAPELVT